jgi:uncharacterized C2H2 Zn-finger protein
MFRFLTQYQNRSSSHLVAAATATIINSTVSKCVVAGVDSFDVKNSIAIIQPQNFSCPTTFFIKPSRILLQAATTTTDAPPPTSSSHQCPLCGRNFKSQLGLTDHILAKHPEELKKAQLNQQQQKPTTTTSATTENGTLEENSASAPAGTKETTTTTTAAPEATSPPPPAAAAANETTNSSASATEQQQQIPQTLFRCEHCNRTFKTREATIAHIKDKHKDLLLRAQQMQREAQLKREAQAATTSTSTSTSSGENE